VPISIQSMEVASKRTFRYTLDLGIVYMDLGFVQSQPCDCMQLATFGPSDQNKQISISSSVFWFKKIK
jgi:hypothetical protein